MKNLIPIFLLCLLIPQSLKSQSLTPRTHTPNATVFDMASKGDTLYVVGAFREVGYRTGGAALLKQDLRPELNFPITDGDVLAITGDGQGGWYLGGAFTLIDTFQRTNLAHVLPSGDVDPAFDLVVNAEVLTLDRNGQTLYLGGKFTDVEGQARNRIAAIDLNTNTLTSWNPDADNQVNSIAAWNDTMMVGGWFKKIGGIYQPGFTALDANTGLALQSKSPGNGQVYAIVADGDKLYLGGNFLGSAGYFTDRTSAFSPGSADFDKPNFSFPRISGNVYAVVDDGQGGWYIGGAFGQVNGQSTLRLIHVLSDFSIDPTFSPAPSGTIYALAQKGDTLYVGGSFSNIYGQSRSNLAAIDLSTNTLTNWQPEPNGIVRALEVMSGNIIVGGNFTRISDRQYPRFAVLDAASGIPSDTKTPVSGEVLAFKNSPNGGGHLFVGGSFNGDVGYSAQRVALFEGMSEISPSTFPSFNNAVRVAISDGVGGYYIAGQFTQANGTLQRRLTHVLPDQSIDPNFEFNINNAVYSMFRSGNLLYLGGAFTSIDGTARNRLAAIDLTTNTLTSWDPNANNQVNVMIPDGGTVLIGGRFTSMGGQTRNRLASVDLTSGVVNSWNPDANNDVNDLLVQGSEVYVAGKFTQIGGISRNRLARLDITSGVPDTWNPDFNNEVKTMVFGTVDTLYVGGSFTQTNGGTVPRNRLAAINLTNGNTHPGFDPNMNNIVWDVEFWNDTMMVAGQFTQAGGIDRSRMAAFSGSTGNLLPWQADPNGTVYTLAHIDNDLITGGVFTATNTETRNRLMDFSPSTYALQPFAPNVNQTINTLEVYQNDLLIGGNFTQFNGQTRTRLARYNFVTDNLDAWDPGADAQVNDILRWNDTMMVAGDFSQLGGLTRSNLGGFSLSGGGLLAWNPSANGDAQVLGWNDTMMIVGGEFTHFDHVIRNRMMGIDLTTDEINNWNPDLPGLLGGPRVNAIAPKGDSVWVGGFFGTIGGQSRGNLALTDAQTGQILAADIPVDGEVFALGKFNDTMMVIMGNFNQVGGESRRYGAAVDLTTSTLHPFAPEMESYGKSVAFNDTMMVLGGEFSQIYNQTRKGGYALDTQTGTLLDWHPEVGQNEFINKVLVDSANDYVYLGGTFGSIQGQMHEKLARVDMINGIPDSSWNASSNQLIHEMELDVTRDILYVSGNFSMLNGQPRNYIGAIDGSGNLTGFDPAPDQEVYQIELLDSTVMVAGPFSNIGGATRDRLAQLDLNGQAMNWAPKVLNSTGFPGIVNALEISSDRIYIGGFFREVNGQTRHRLATFDLAGNLLPWAPPVNPNQGTNLQNVTQIKSLDNHLFVLGNFSEIAGISVTNFAWLDAPSGLVRDMRIIPNSFLHDIEILDSLIYLGGDFNQINQEDQFYVSSFSFPKDFFAAGFSDIIPNKGGNVGDVTVNIYGAGFDQHVKIILRATGMDDIVGFDSLTSVLNGQQIKTTFNLRGQVPGVRDVWIVRNGDSTVLAGAFEIVADGKAEPWADVLTPSAIRFVNFQNGGEHKIYITYGNTGNIDAEGVPIWFAADTALEVVDFDFDWIPLPDSAIDPNDSVYYAVMVDSITDIKFPANVYCIVIPRVPAGFQGQLGLTIKPKRIGNLRVDAWATAPLYGSPLKYYMPECMDALLGKLIGFVPGGDCVYNAMDALLSPMFDAAYDTDNFASASWASNYVFTLGKALVSCGILVTGGGLVLDMLSDLLRIKDVVDDINAILACLEMRPKPTPNVLPVLNSTDPNQKSGPGGVGTAHWVNHNEPMSYLIEFENVDTATAPAVQVVILDTLDVNVYNLNTLNLNFFTIADSQFSVPYGRKIWTAFADLRPGINTLVRMDASLNGNVLKWEFVSLDPVTLEPQLGVTDGFLPPNVNDPEGTGSVGFTIQRWDNLPTNTTVSNRAAIVFDSNPALITNSWSNTIDNDLPVSAVNALSDTMPTVQIPISWTSSDVGSGVRYVDIYASKNSDPYEPIAYSVGIEDTLMFTVESGNGYRFYSIATDSVWNEEAKPFSPDAETFIPLMVGVSEASVDISSVVYPNPNSGTCILEMEIPSSSDLQLEVVDMRGNIVLRRQEQLTAGKNHLELNLQQASGIYLLRIRTKWGQKAHLVAVRN